MRKLCDSFFCETPNQTSTPATPCSAEKQCIFVHVSLNELVTMLLNCSSNVIRVLGLGGWVSRFCFPLPWSPGGAGSRGLFVGFLEDSATDFVPYSPWFRVLVPGFSVAASL